MADWATISQVATAGGTLILAIATFSSVRSANRSARIAELSLLAGLRPLLIPSREEDPPERVRFGDGQLLTVPGHGAAAALADERLYLAMALRNGGTGLAVIHGWRAQARGDAVADVPTSTSSARSSETSTSRPATRVSGRARSATAVIPPTSRSAQPSRAASA